MAPARAYSTISHDDEQARRWLAARTRHRPIGNSVVRVGSHTSGKAQSSSHPSCSTPRSHAAVVRDEEAGIAEPWSDDGGSETGGSLPQLWQTANKHMTRDSLRWSEIEESAYKARLLFVTTELDVARSFASIALAWSRRRKLSWASARRSRSEQLARTAYESAIHFLRRGDLSPDEAKRLAAKQQQVETILEELTRSSDQTA